MFTFAADVIAHLHAAGLPYKHFEVEGRWSEGFGHGVPSFIVGLSEMSEFEDVARSLRLRTPDGAEAAVRAWFDRQLAGTNARFGRLSLW